jgi:hypothetical protein
MPLVMKFIEEAESDVAPSRLPKPFRRRPRPYAALAALALDAVVIGAALRAGHPIIAAWLAVICIALLFLGGAANTSDRG